MGFKFQGRWAMVTYKGFNVSLFQVSKGSELYLLKWTEADFRWVMVVINL
jgi:hypothetical protein